MRGTRVIKIWTILSKDLLIERERNKLEIIVIHYSFWHYLDRVCDHSKLCCWTEKNKKCGGNLLFCQLDKLSSGLLI